MFFSIQHSNAGLYRGTIRRTSFCLVLAAMLVGSTGMPQQARAQSVGEVIVATKQVISAVRTISRNWAKVKWVFTGMKHTWWACVYQDGFTVYNNPRSYRSPDVVLNSFMGYDGDCDPFYYTRNGGKARLCYTSPGHAQRYAQQHGPIVDLKYQDKSGNWISVLNTH